MIIRNKIVSLLRMANVVCHVIINYAIVPHEIR